MDPIDLLDSDREMDFEDISDAGLTPPPPPQRNHNIASSTSRPSTSFAASTSNRPSFRQEQVREQPHQPEELYTFKPETIAAIFKIAFNERSTKVHKEALELSAEYLRLFTVEAFHRATLHQRQHEDQEIRSDLVPVELESLESILPQLALDF